MEIELAGFDRDRRVPLESKLRQHRRNLEEVKRQYVVTEKQ